MSTKKPFKTIKIKMNTQKIPKENINHKYVFFLRKRNIYILSYTTCSKLTYNLGFADHAFSHDREALILSTVQAIRLLTVATEPRESFAVGTESTKI